MNPFHRMLDQGAPAFDPDGFVRTHRKAVDDTAAGAKAARAERAAARVAPVDPRTDERWIEARAQAALGNRAPLNALLLSIGQQPLPEFG